MGGVLISEKEPLKDRLSVGTNALEWLLTVPNVQVGYDLSASEYNNKSILFGVKYNWDTYHKLPPFYVFNVFDLRGEYRYHFRHGLKDLSKTFRQARYLGGYADWSSYSLKPGATGRQGWQTGLGVSAGIEIPLYEYPKGAVDMDLGVSAGLVFTRFYDYALNESATVFVMKQEAPRWFLLPMVTELRASFTWRKSSVRTKYVKTDPEIPVYRQAISDIESDFRATTKADFDDYQKSIGRLSEIQKVDTTYRGEFVRWIKITQDDQLHRIVEMLPVNDTRKSKLRRYVLTLAKRAVRDFDAAVREEKKARLKEAREVEKATREAEKEAAITEDE